MYCENVLGWVQEGVNWTLKDFSQFRPLKIVFAIWKALKNLGDQDIRCSKEMNWFKPWMNQFVLQIDRKFQTPHIAYSQSHIRFTTVPQAD